MVGSLPESAALDFLWKKDSIVAERKLLHQISYFCGFSLASVRLSSLPPLPQRENHYSWICRKIEQNRHRKLQSGTPFGRETVKYMHFVWTFELRQLGTRFLDLVTVKFITSLKLLARKYANVISTSFRTIPLSWVCQDRHE